MLCCLLMQYVFSPEVRASQCPHWVRHGGSSSLCIVFGNGQWQMSMKAMRWTYNDVSQEVQHFGSQRAPEMASLCLRSPDSNSLPLPGALHANTRQAVHWKRCNLCQCERRKCASKMWWEFPWSHHRSALQQDNVPRVIEIRSKFALAVHPDPCSTFESHWLQNRLRMVHLMMLGNQSLRTEVDSEDRFLSSDIFCLWKPISWASDNIGEYWYVTKLANSFLWAWEPNVDPEGQVLLAQCCIPDSGQW